jgi:hypothetical protein
MNPLNYIIKPQDEAIIISDDQDAANSIWVVEDQGKIVPYNDSSITIYEEEVN